ncbi:sensor histidine kinase [Bifidobacterium tibiigranuli]|uniref:histidine kinase n=1 Tax=Bifidobacterium tibiigranuli TaxID=2172043 RepID=A0A5N6S6Z8_9BIFI|nr:histidine kinase [Bifidobacterium tibiigranuli]KAE8130296.1 sensor histidine kinase [Bifidobacterium tibiigranuli]KAE8130345.1 sensor histidine kinase [Bifidobacterium tibiigranuli]MCI1222336.1 histidine kinase [Bifidobacterium tibiigranuli]
MSRLRGFIAWCRRCILPSDVLLALGILLLLAINTGVPKTEGLLAYHGAYSQVLWSIALTLPVPLRRWKPEPAAGAFAMLSVVQLIAGPSIVLTDCLALVMLYSVIVYGKPALTRRFVVLACCVGAMAALIMAWASVIGPASAFPKSQCVAGKTGSYGDIFGSFSGCFGQFAVSAGSFGVAIGVCLASTVIIAYWTRARLATVRLLQERNASIEAREGEERRIAALAERARIARDMHDVVAHTLSIIIVQSDGGRYAGTHDPAVARSTMETIRHESEHALHDMRRVLGALGGSTHADYHDIDTLLAQASAASPDCRFARRVAGTPAPDQLDAKASAALYHVVQESLTNIRKYAGPKVKVLISETWGESGMELAISDDGRGAGATLDGHASGYGLIGMRERIEAARGTLSAGPQLSGGFAVHAFVPYSGQTAAQSVVDDSDTDNRNRDDAGHLYDAAEANESSSIAFDSNDTEFGSAPRSEAQSAHYEATCNAETGNGNETGAAASRIIDSSASSTRLNANTEASGVNSAISGNEPPHAALSHDELSHNDVPHDDISHELDFSIVLKTRLSDIMQMLRAKPLDQALPQSEGRFNWVERLSQWSERHYLLIDILIMLCLIVFSCAIDYVDLFRYPHESMIVVWMLSIVSLLPLALRRQAPEFSAACVAIFSALQLVFYSPMLTSNIFALLSLYSVIVYGRARARRWVWAAVLVNVVLLGVKVALPSGYDSIFIAMLGTSNGNHYTYDRSQWEALASGGGFAIVLAMLCAGTIALGLWVRASGSNALVLRSREEALRAEREQQKILAANLERDRISASIQAEVTHTLTGVIDQAVAGLRMLDDLESRGEQPSPQDLASAFEDIGSRGRSALADMRQLLGVLRETGFSDAARSGAAHGSVHGDAAEGGHGMQLKPARNLDEQFETTAHTA